MPKGSLVLDLQRLAESSSTDIGELMRKAKVVAVKLGLSESARWLEHEMNGYPAGIDLPKYRVIPCQLQARNPFHGWQPVIFETSDWVSDHFSSASFPNPVGQIEYLIANRKNGDGLTASLLQPETELLMKLSPDLAAAPLSKLIQRADLASIVDAVRNRILGWALELEQQNILARG